MNFLVNKILSKLTLTLAIIAYVSGSCKFLHQCNIDSSGKYQNCINDDDTPPINSTDSDYEEITELLLPYCEALFEDIEDGAEPEFCCDKDQVIKTIEGFSQMAPFQRCPTCVRNLQHSICIFSCHPQQASFVESYEAAINETSKLNLIQYLNSIPISV